MKNLGKAHYYFLAGWFIINLLQAIFTGLHSDESYYWMYSQNLDWGYFDHPPMAAFLIYLGSSLIPGELGVRLMMVILSTLTLALLMSEINEKNELFFLFVFILSFPLIHSHIAGFLAIPDIPLLFFTMLFLVLYKSFLTKPGWLNTVLLGVVIAGLIYSKYHAFLLIGFTLLSNIRLLKNRFTYIIIVVSVILLIPHFLWQIDHQFPTFRYHLIERAKPFRLKYVFPYLAGVLAVTGPLTGVIVFWKLRKVKIESVFQRTLIFNIAGFIGLFFFMSFKNRIEMHWVAAIMPMLMILTFPLIKNDGWAKKWFVRLAAPFVVLMFLYRIYLALDVIPNVGNLKITFYNRESNALQIKELARGKTVGFYNNYAAISNYIFYTGDSAVYLSTPDYRFNQYDLWDFQHFATGDSVLAIQSKHMNPPNLTKMTTGETKGFIVIGSFQSLKGLNIEIDSVTPENNAYLFLITLKNTTTLPFQTRHSTNPALVFKNGNREVFQSLLGNLVAGHVIPAGKSVQVKVRVAKTFISKALPVQIYTCTKENYRGELTSLRMDSLP